jgi:hypothetical protein
MNGNNICKVKSTWYDNTTTTKVEQSYTVSITIPDGYYSIQTLLPVINILFSTATFPDTVNKYYFGSADNVSYPGLYVDTLYKNTTVGQYASLLTQAYTLALNTHVITSYSIVVDSTTIKLLKMLGFVQNNVNILSSNLPILKCTGVTSGTTTIYTLLSSNDWISYTRLISTGHYSNTYFTAYFSYDMNYITSLYLSLANTLAQNKSTYSNLTATDFMYRIPIQVSYGGTINWQATLEQQAYVPDIKLNGIHITIVDQYGGDVDFRGMNWDMDIGIKFGVNYDAENRGGATDLNLPEVGNRRFNGNGIIQTLAENQDHLYPRTVTRFQTVNDKKRKI